MKIWLLENGEKSEPQESFEVRERITSGELTADTMAWYKGADAWMRLDEVPQFQTLFEEAEEDTLDTPPPLPDLSVSLKEAIAIEAEKAPPLRMFRRLFARFFDSFLYMSLVTILFHERIVSTVEGGSMLVFLSLGFAYTILDGAMTHSWKCSPGKFLLGLRISDQHGEPIQIKSAILRSLRVWIIGLGMWQLWFISMPISWLMSRKFGYFLWDIPYRYRVLAKPFSGVHIVAYIFALIAVYAALLLALPLEFFEEVIYKFGTPEHIEQWKEMKESLK